MDKVQKFLLRLSRKDRAFLSKIFSDIQVLNLNSYDIKPLRGLKGVFRLRTSVIRIIFVKGNNGGIIIDVAFRKDIYKKL